MIRILSREGITYRDLLFFLNDLQEEDLDTTVSVYHIQDDEVYPVVGIDRSDESIAHLDLNHFILLI